jgi:hypothetical protein
LFSDGIENLLIDQVRVSFRDDTLKLQSINQNKDQVRAKAKAKESKLNDGASSRLVKLQACLDRFGADFDDVSAKIKVRDEDQKNLRELIDRGSAGHCNGRGKVRC